MSPRGRSPWEWAAVAAIAATFLAAASRSLTLPGVSYDEANAPAFGMEVVKGLPGTPTDWSLSLAGRSWPLRTPQPYEFCAFSIYWSALAFRLAGVSVLVMRWAGLLLAAGALVVFYGFAREWFEARTALLASALLAAHPAFFVWSRFSFQAVETFLGLFAFAALWLASVWHKRRAPWALYAACFVLGASANVSTKSLAFLLALPAVYLVLVPREDWPSRAQAAVGALCLAAGAADPLLYCLRHGNIVHRLASAAAGEQTSVGVDNLAFRENLLRRVRQLGAVLAGTCPTESAGPVQGWCTAGAALIVGLGAAGSGRLLHGREPRRAVRVLVALTGLVFLETCLTPHGLHCQHLLVVVPLAVLVGAWGLLEGWTGLPGGARPAAGAACAALLAITLATEARVDANYLSALERTGGRETWSDAFYAAAGYLQERGIARPVCLSWGFARNLYLESGGRVAPVELHNFRRPPDEALLADFRRALADPGTRYLLFDEGVPNLGQSTGAVLAFRREAQAAGKRLVLEKTFTDRLGRPVFALYRSS